MVYKRIVVSGSLAFDHIMSMPGRFQDHIMPDKIHALNVSFIMGSFTREYGGTGGNIAYSLAMLGVPATLVGSAGNDFADYLIHLTSLATINLEHLKIWQDVPTAQGFVMTDRDDNQIWGFYEGAMAKDDQIALDELLKNGDLLMIAPSNAKAMIARVAQAKANNIAYVFDPAFNIPHFSDEDLSEAVKTACVLIGNDYEIELTRRRLRWSEADFFDSQRIVVTTLGKEGSRVRQGKNEYVIPAVKLESVADPTGAGDAYRAGFLAAFVAGKDLETCGRMGSVCASYSVEQYGTQKHKFTQDEFNQRLAEL